MGPLHAYALASRLEQVADHDFALNQGTLYPALVRLEHEPPEAPALRELFHRVSKRSSVLLNSSISRDDGQELGRLAE
jgi:hypothetical protein